MKRGNKGAYDFQHNGERHTATIGPKQAAIDAMKAIRGGLLDERLAAEYGERPASPLPH
ncbi:MAG TPA: hypothetical protein VEL75_09605 [Candidatus Methylomirabilis sp.]|nr:hypothetical protein [Candidatus Methylomirabilis sp.]